LKAASWLCPSLCALILVASSPDLNSVKARST
jgi:hypothetical protein